MEKTNGKLDITRQYAFAEEIARLRLNKKYCIVTMGCQMNVRDSETLCGWLSLMGFKEAKAREDADIIIYNTCCVRENAENKALGNVIWLKELKKTRDLSSYRAAASALFVSAGFDPSARFLSS